MSDKSPTERLREMLDERGVEWTAPNSILRDEMTCWMAGGFDYEAFEIPEPDGTFLLTAAHQEELTPEQAIAATLGSDERYDAGFANGVKATLQQLDGLITDGYDLKAISVWIDDQWEES